VSGAGIDEDGLKESLAKTVGGLHSGPAWSAPIDVVYAGLSGIDKAAPESVKARIASHLADLTGSRRVIFDEDADLGLAFASCLNVSLDQPRVVVLAGTGTGFMGINRHGVKQSMHGWGSIIGDEGSAYDIGMRMLKAVSRAFDGRGPDTLLKQLLFEAPRFHSCDNTRAVAGRPAGELTYLERNGAYREIHSAIYFSNGMGREEIAALSRWVHRAAQEGDQTAAAVLQSIGRELARGVQVLARNLELGDEEFVVVPVGGVFRAGAYVLDELEEVLSSAMRAQILPPVFCPVIGALVMGLTDLGVGLDHEVRRNLQEYASGFSERED